MAEWRVLVYLDASVANIPRANCCSREQFQLCKKALSDTAITVLEKKKKQNPSI